MLKKQSDVYLSVDQPRSLASTIMPETSLSPTPSFQEIKVKVLVDFGNGKIISQELVAVSAFDALQKLADKSKLTVLVKQYKYGLVVEKVGETANSSDRTWVFLINGKTFLVAADKVLVTSGDKVEWKYQKTK